jgi:hypothetical protein
MAVKEKAIKKTVDLREVPSSGSQVVGISDLDSMENIHKRDVAHSRGEVAGYFCGNDQVILFRDRLGARNIYYSVDDDLVTISTDLDWIAQNVKTEPNWQYILTDYLQFQIPFSDETFFSGIKKVMPGELVYISNDGRIKSENYWDLEFGDASFDPQYLSDLIRSRPCATKIGYETEKKGKNRRSRRRSDDPLGANNCRRI